MSVLRDYLAYAKDHIHPTLSADAQQRLIQAYVDMRKVGAGRGQISAYPRQLESLIRLAEAHAKVRLSPTVQIEDVEEAWRQVFHNFLFSFSFFMQQQQNYNEPSF